MDDIKQLKNRGSEKVYRHYLPEWTGNTNVLCPFHEDRQTKSLSIYTAEEGDYRYKCHGCGIQGDCIDFVQRIEGLDFEGALKRVKDLTGVPSVRARASKAFTLDHIRKETLEGQYHFDRLHIYRSGFPVYLKAIYRDPANRGDKRAMIYHQAGKDRWVPGRMSQPVLYNQEVLAKRPTDMIIYCEGEKDCDTLVGLDFLAVTAGGAQDFRDSFLVHFQGRDVVVIGDCDQAGEESADRIAGLLGKVAKSVKRLDLRRVWDEYFA